MPAPGARVTLAPSGPVPSSGPLPPMKKPPEGGLYIAGKKEYFLSLGTLPSTPLT
jgi:hypothetical protein